MGLGIPKGDSMAGIVTNFGERLLLDTAWSHAPALTAHLVKQNFTVSNDMATIDMIEADFLDYAPLTLTYAGLEVGNPGGRAIADFAPLIWICGGVFPANHIWGWWVQTAAGNVVWVEKFIGNPRPMMDLGQQVTIEPTNRLFSPS